MCVDYMWFGAWFTLNISVTMVNKIFYTSLNAPYPWAMTSAHLALSGLLSALLLTGCVTKRYSSEKVPWRTQRKLIGLSFLFVLNIALGNASLVHASVPFVQMVRCTVPAMTAGLSYLIMGTTQSPRELMALVPVVFGAMLVIRGEIQLTVVGAAITLLGCVLCAVKAVVTAQQLSGEDKVSPVALLRTVGCVGTLESIPVVLVWEPGYFQGFLATAPAYVLLLLLLHATQAFALNIANFESTKATSATLMTVGGNLKCVVTSLISVLYFGNPTSYVGMAGVVMTVGGTYWWFVLHVFVTLCQVHE
eukprot:TRINITY_DN50804_c0_g1_i2.p1 TRINITY_DN50804_c0_g1~~TRINITY_DN50804_c0_g1_i2.p1  ORF type:complete len:306 (-),score=54.87 TRINITY_DN50804_c0_g1_i2:308-1225(-)